VRRIVARRLFRLHRSRSSVTARNPAAMLQWNPLERDIQDEWQFVRSDAREKIRFAPTLTTHGDELREAGLAGCGIIRLLACNVEDELRSGALVRVLPDWECLGGLPIVATYRKTRPTLSRVNAFVRWRRRFSATNTNASGRSPAS
jgi:DNA-binding transcriptional LysR family regulator